MKKSQNINSVSLASGEARAASGVLGTATDEKLASVEAATHDSVADENLLGSVDCSDKSPKKKDFLQMSLLNDRQSKSGSMGLWKIKITKKLTR